MSRRPPTQPPLVLASSSPRRMELLRSAGYRFEVIAPLVDEPDRHPHEQTPAEHAEELSYLKASDVAGRIPAGLVLGADTIVVYQDVIFGKPVDLNDARRILTTIAGTTHRVITGVTLLDARTGRRNTTHAISILTMRPLESDEMNDYLASDAWAGKAGAYGVQDKADAFVTSVDGSFSNVVGLPLELLEQMLADWPDSDPDRR